MTRQQQTDTQADRRKRKFSFFANALLKEKELPPLNFLSGFLYSASFSTFASRAFLFVRKNTNKSRTPFGKLAKELNPSRKTKTLAKKFSFAPASWTAPFIFQNFRNFDNHIKTIKMKTMTIIMLSLIGLLSFNSCKKDTSTICDNLLEQGIATSISLKGEWEFKHFAYTANGNKIKNKDEIHKGYINVTDTGTIWLYHTNTMNYEVTLNNSNGITVTLKGSTYINPPQEETEISNAFGNSQCYVIKGNELLIHYSEKDKKNILILNKK